MSSYTVSRRRRRQAKLEYIGPELAKAELWDSEPNMAYLQQLVANNAIARWYDEVARAKTITCGADGCRPRLFSCALTRDRMAVTVCPDCFDPELHVLEKDDWIRNCGDL